MPHFTACWNNLGTVCCSVRRSAPRCRAVVAEAGDIGEHGRVALCGLRLARFASHGHPELRGVRFRLVDRASMAHVIDYVEFAVDDLMRVKAFYGRTLESWEDRFDVVAIGVDTISLSAGRPVDLQLATPVYSESSEAVVVFGGLASQRLSGIWLSKKLRCRRTRRVCRHRLNGSSRLVRSVRWPFRRRCFASTDRKRDRSAGNARSDGCMGDR